VVAACAGPVEEPGIADDDEPLARRSDVIALASGPTVPSTSSRPGSPRHRLPRRRSQPDDGRSSLLEAAVDGVALLRL